MGEERGAIRLLVLHVEFDVSASVFFYFLSRPSDRSVVEEDRGAIRLLVLHKEFDVKTVFSLSLY